jgi:co-chaperonin GroES (HSP10)
MHLIDQNHDAISDATGLDPVVPFQPAGHCVLVDPILPDASSRGGVVIPENVMRRMPHPRRAKVVRVGPGHDDPASGKHIPCAYSIGQTISYSVESGIEWPYEGHTYLLLFEQHILGAFE